MDTLFLDAWYICNMVGETGARHVAALLAFCYVIDQPIRAFAPCT